MNATTKLEHEQHHHPYHKPTGKEDAKSKNLSKTTPAARKARKMKIV
jgi:hypothetical protein